MASATLGPHMEPLPSAPPVVAVVVACDPGDWLEQTLAALGAQDYPNLSVLVVDAGTPGDLRPRVGAVVPDAYVRRLESAGFARAANEALLAVEGASFLLFCHDDVAPDPDALRLLVEEAMRSNAGIVGPKLVQWERPERLADVGLAVDRVGVAHPLVERGELDQEQHDSVRDVFAVPSACTLVRSDLFTVLSGFDTVMGDHGSDVDLCWRAQAVGARVMVVPAARVRHLEAERSRPASDGDDIVLSARYRLRALLKNYSPFHLVRVLPLAAFYSLTELAGGLVSGRRSQRKAALSAWVWNLRRLGELRRARRVVQRGRRLPDAELRRLQVRGSVLRAYRRGEVGEPEDEERVGTIASAGRRVAGTLQRASAREIVLVWAAMIAVLLIGSRHLLGGRFPAVGQLTPFPHHATELIHRFLAGARTTGLGSEAPSPPGFAFLGMGGLALLGNMGLLQRVLVLGAWPVGAFGSWRWSRALGSTRARLVTTVVYLVAPVAMNGLARGRWAVLAAYAVAPWFLSALSRASNLAPFGDGTGTRRGKVLRLGLLVAVAGAFVPALALVLVAVALGLVLGSVLAGGAKDAVRAVAVAAGAVVVAATLLFPWSLDLVLPGREWASLAGAAPGPAHAPGFGALLRFQIGPVGAPPLGWAFVIAAALPLLIGRGWRLAWAVRLWMVALVCVGVAWASGRGWVLSGVDLRDAMLAPAAMALAGAAAMGMVAFENDLPGYRFGLRQLVSVAAAAAVAAATLPVLAAAGGGRWRTPTRDVSQTVSWMPAQARGTSFRVLWLGDPDVLPAPGWRLGPGLAYATSVDGPPDASELWPGSSNGPTGLIADAVTVARRGDTTRLGHLLAPMAIRYVAVPSRLAPGAGSSPEFPPPASVPAALAAQIDLRQLPSDPSLLVYENTASGPVRSALPRDLADGLPARLSVGADLSQARPVLPGRSLQLAYRGRVGPDSDVYLSDASGRWKLTVAGRSASRRQVFGWASVYRVPTGGRAVLSYRTSLVRYLAVAAQLVLWVLAVRGLIKARRRRREIEA
jgi:GT2 family glycosyltransferase